MPIIIIIIGFEYRMYVNFKQKRHIIDFQMYALCLPLFVNLS